MYQPTTEERNAVAFALQEGEELLWMQRSKIGRSIMFNLLVIIGSLFLLYFTATVCGIMHGTRGDNSGALTVSFGLLALINYLLAYWVYRHNRRRIYALTNQRVLFIYPGIIFKPAVCTLQLAQDLIYKVKRRRNGTVDYLMCEDNTGDHTIAAGFLRVSKYEALEAAFARLGITVPEPHTQRPKRYAIARKLPPLIAATAQLLAAILIPVILLTQTNAGNEVLLLCYGKDAQGTVIDKIKKTNREGLRRRHKVTRHYPIVSYAVNGQPYKSIAQNGDKDPEWQVGDTIRLKYAPSAPHLCIRRDNSLLIMPGLGLLGSLVLLGCSYSSFRRWQRTRHDTYYLYEGTTI